MSEKRMLLIDSGLLSKIDENRGDMSRTEFLDFIIESQLRPEQEKVETIRYVSREEYQQFTQTMRELMRNCLDFFVSVGMEKSGPTKENQAYEEMVKRLQGITGPESKVKTSK
jgi:hypothetical protein